MKEAMFPCSRDSLPFRRKCACILIFRIEYKGYLTLTGFPSVKKKCICPSWNTVFNGNSRPNRMIANSFTQVVNVLSCMSVREVLSSILDFNSG
jgi:hypothetical protein